MAIIYSLLVFFFLITSFRFVFNQTSIKIQQCNCIETKYMNSPSDLVCKELSKTEVAFQMNLSNSKVSKALK